jgi:outer membrane protein
LNLQANYELNNAAPFSPNGSNNYSVLGMFSINLFKGLGDSAQVRKARAEETKARHLLEAKRRSIEVEVVDSASKLISAHERLKVTARAVAQAEENLRILGNRYQAGLAPVLDLFTAELVLAQAKHNRLHALYDFRISHSRLNLVTGKTEKGLG